MIKMPVWNLFTKVDGTYKIYSWQGVSRMCTASLIDCARVLVLVINQYN